MPPSSFYPYRFRFGSLPNNCQTSPAPPSESSYQDIFSCQSLGHPVLACGTGFYQQSDTVYRYRFKRLTSSAEFRLLWRLVRLLETKQVAHFDEELALRHQAWGIYPLSSVLGIEGEVLKAVVIAHVNRRAWVKEISKKNVGSNSLSFVEIYELRIRQDGVVVENGSE